MSDFTFKDNTGLFLAMLKEREEVIAQAIGDKMEGYAVDNLRTFEHNGKNRLCGYWQGKRKYYKHV